MPSRGVASGGDLRTLLARAVAEHRAGRLSEAGRLYDLVLAADPCHGFPENSRAQPNACGCLGHDVGSRASQILLL